MTEEQEAKLRDAMAAVRKISHLLQDDRPFQLEKSVARDLLEQIAVGFGTLIDVLKYGDDAL